MSLRFFPFMLLLLLPFGRGLAETRLMIRAHYIERVA
jgi:hypothetical protein